MGEKEYEPPKFTGRFPTVDSPGDPFEIARLYEKIEKYEKILFSLGAMNKAPCFKCGYNGPGYFQPNSHPCAKMHHDLDGTG